MDNELIKYYENRFEMFSSPGWKQLLEDVEKMKESTKDIRQYNDEKSFWKAKGEMAIIDWLLNLELISTAGYNQLKEED